MVNTPVGRRIAAIIRHGDYHQLPGTPSAHQPFPLNADGEKHAHNAAAVIYDIIQQYGWSLLADIDSSRMLRGWQTARIITDDLSEKLSQPLQITSFDELAERSVGAAANLTAKQIQEIIHNDPRFPDLPENWKANSEFCLPLQGAESLLQSGERVAAHLRTRMTALPTNNADVLKLFVGHGAAFRHAAYYLGVLQYEEIQKLSMYHGSPVFLELLHDGSWQHIAGDWKVRPINSAYMD
jgi:2,3-bisphosphoglycerate-dependent phosphoglycerate mutase